MRYQMKSDIGIKEFFLLLLGYIGIIILFGLVAGILAVIAYNFIYYFNLFVIYAAISSVMGILLLLALTLYTVRFVINSIYLVKVDEVEIIIPVEKKESKKIKEEVKEEIKEEAVETKESDESEK